jgi:cell division protein ZapA
VAQLTIDINGRAYGVGCEDGQEEHLRALSRLFDAQVRELAESVGQLGETRLLVMGALMMADETAEARTRIAQLQVENNRLRTELGALEHRAVQVMEAASKRIELLAEQGSAGTLL